MRPRRIAVSALVVLALSRPVAAPPVSAAQPSPATSAVACSTLVPGDVDATIDVDGTSREVLIHVPPAAAGPGDGLPLVIAFHGFGAYAPQLATTSQLDPLADADGFVVAYPQAVGATPTWFYPGGPNEVPVGVDDLRLVEVLLDRAASEGCIDTQRVVLMGHSMGGAMAQAGACAFADRVAGLVLVSAVQSGVACEPSRPVPVVATHAVDDPVLPYAGGQIPIAPSWFPAQQPAEEAIAAWATRDGCSGDPEVTPDADGGAVLEWQGCAAPVVLHRLAQGGHAYPALASELVRGLVVASQGR